MASGSASAHASRCNREICNFTNYAKAHVHVIRMKLPVLDRVELWIQRKFDNRCPLFYVQRGK